MTRIVEVREQAVRLEAAIRNSLIDFSQMTVSVVAVITDRVVDGRPVVGLGFNSIGRYAASGILRDRFIPRLLQADPDSLLDDAGELDPALVRDLVMKNEKPGGHGERSGAGRPWISRSGTRRQARRRPPVPPAGRPLQRRVALTCTWTSTRRAATTTRTRAPTGSWRRCAATSTRDTRI